MIATASCAEVSATHEVIVQFRPSMTQEEDLRARWQVAGLEGEGEVYVRACNPLCGIRGGCAQGSIEHVQREGGIRGVGLAGKPAEPSG